MKKILIAGLIAGTLDAIAAVLLSVNTVTLHSISGIFRYIASGLLGKESSPGLTYPIIGLILHYLIAISWSAIYFLFLSHVFKPGTLWVKVVLFATLIWIVMNGFVMPVFNVAAHYDGRIITRSFLVLVICVSLPICFIAERRKV